MQQQTQQSVQEKIENKSPIKINWKLFEIIGLVAIILAVGGILLLKTLQPSPVPSPQPFSAPNGNENWKTYRNTVYNFSVDYPADWTLDYYYSSIGTAEEAEIVLFDKYTDRTLVLTEQVTVGIYADHNEQGLPLKDFILAGGTSIDYPLILDFFDAEAEADYRAERVSEMAETTLREFEALQDGENRLFVNTGATVFVFYIDSLNDISVEDRAIFNRILSSLKLTDSADTSGWQTYRNDEYGFEVKYPQDWEIPKDSDGMVFRPISEEEKMGRAIHFGIFPLSNNQRFEEILTRYTAFGESDKRPKIEDFTIKRFGSNSFYYIFPYLFEGQYRVEYYIVGEDKVIRFSASDFARAGQWTDPNYDVDQEPVHIMLKQILSTFQFVEEKKDVDREGFLTPEQVIERSSELDGQTIEVVGQVVLSGFADSFGLGYGSPAFVTKDNQIELPSWDYVWNLAEEKALARVRGTYRAPNTENAYSTPKLLFPKECTDCMQVLPWE